jgi:hypothetical protein
MNFSCALAQSRPIQSIFQSDAAHNCNMGSAENQKRGSLPAETLLNFGSASAHLLS